MRLSKLKLSGFKSFVDPTTVLFPSSLAGVVGPNGCGKSNVIDAVRWVMGESSAKHLRGDSMADVIFNGSTARKPVAQASVELVFDNSDGGLGGQYANYSEIALRRQVSRDGQSAYFLNNARCRRRDITDIFLGTGLGPRSYSIIEQGMISRLIEAKPEDLRVFFEEAAGISKYKERRRETENRIRHTHENLSRVNDLREEIDKQLEKLKRQARSAERFKALRDQERRVKAELLALRYQALHEESGDRRKLIQENETRLQAVTAELRSVEAALEKGREAHIEASDRFNAVQGRYYELGAEVVPLAVEPDGFNINKDCGATAPGKLCQAVIDHGADLGIALDGDADRMVMADENGRLVDGDQILGLITRSWRESEVLRGGGIVGTVMANLGLERYLGGLGLDLRRTPVGDRYVVERMREGGYNLGGEQSGHIVFSDYSTTGDGLIAALQVLAVLVQDGGKASQVTRVFEPLPQVLKNVPLGGGATLDDAAVREAVAAGERALGDSGRLLIRKSGTEPVVRVMGEGADAKAVGDVVETIARTIAKAAG